MLPGIDILDKPKVTQIQSHKPSWTAENISLESLIWLALIGTERERSLEIDEWSWMFFPILAVICATKRFLPFYAPSSEYWNAWRKDKKTSGIKRATAEVGKSKSVDRGQPMTASLLRHVTFGISDKVISPNHTFWSPLYIPCFVLAGIFLF